MYWWTGGIVIGYDGTNVDINIIRMKGIIRVKTDVPGTRIITGPEGKKEIPLNDEVIEMCPKECGGRLMMEPGTTVSFDEEGLRVSLT